DQDGGDFAGWHVADEQAVLYIVEDGLTLILAREQRSISVRKRHVGDTRHGRATLLLGLLTGSESQRTHRTPVETTEKADEPRAGVNGPCCRRQCLRQNPGTDCHLRPKLRHRDHATSQTGARADTRATPLWHRGPAQPALWGRAIPSE